MQKFLVINTEAFSVRGLKRKIGFDDLPPAVKKFTSAFSSPFVILDESTKIKTNTPVRETAKSSRCRVIKLLNKTGHRCIMTGTLMSKSPLNVVDQYELLREGYFPEDMYALAERYCVMATIHVANGARRVIISQKIYAEIRNRLRDAYVHGREVELEAAKECIFKKYAIPYDKQEHIIQHKRYTPYLNVDELLRRVAPDTVFVKREDVFDITFDKFVKEPIMRPVELSEEAKAVAKELVEVGFTDNFTLGKARALELLIRLQNVCNGFEPVDVDPLYDQKAFFPGQKPKREIAYRPFKENPKVDSLLELLEEIDSDNNQVVVWSSRMLAIKACKEAFDKAGISYVTFTGKESSEEKEEAERKFKNKEAMVFLASQGAGAYGLNCLSDCSYAVYMCVDDSVEKYHQSMHRILRGELKAPKFTYVIYAKGSVEEKQWEALRVGRELIGTESRKEDFAAY